MNHQRALATFAVILLAIFPGGCVLESAEEANALREAMTKFPLPPGSNEMRIDGDLPTSFYVAAPYANASKEELLQFYRDWFAEHGWTPRFPGETGRPDVLSFEKAGVTMAVIVQDAGPASNLVVTYSEAGEETEAPPEAMELLESIADSPPAPSAPQGEATTTSAGPEGSSPRPGS